MIIKIPKDALDNLNKGAAQEVRNQMLATLKENFERVKKQMIEDFLNHPVTIEIAQGPDYKNNESGTLGGYGGLFSFIGFEADGEDPLKPILEALESTKIEIERATKDGFRYNVILPTPADIFAATPMPWAKGRSWAKGIEKGISGLGYYLNTSYPEGKSGEGVQIRVKLRGGAFKKTKYISALLNKYQAEFKKLS